MAFTARSSPRRSRSDSAGGRTGGLNLQTPYRLSFDVVAIVWHPGIKQKEKLEMAGLYFEQFSVGQTFVHEIRRTVTDMDNILFSALTYNPAAVHIDHEYAKSTEFGKPLMNSIFTLGLIIGLSVQDTTLGTTVGNLGMEDTKFPRPVFAGDTLRSETRILAVRESKSRPTQGIVTFEHRGFNQRNEEIAYCRRTGLMMRRPT
jgi:acyl dehydratase